MNVIHMIQFIQCNSNDAIHMKTMNYIVKWFGKSETPLNLTYQSRQQQEYMKVINQKVGRIKQVIATELGEGERLFKQNFKSTKEQMITLSI